MDIHKIVLLGSSSFTGSSIYTALDSDYQVVRVNRSGEDSEGIFDVVNDPVSALETYVRDASVVINCISNGCVDSCEEDPVGSRIVNLDFVKSLCSLQSEFGFQLIHFSTNAIYDGENPLYSEQSPANPVNKYGEIKHLADNYVESQCENFTILRPITMYGIKTQKQRHNPFSFFYSQLLKHEKIVTVDDVYVNMLNVQDLIRCIKVAVDHSITGTFNISGDDIVNRYDFVSMIKDQVPDSRSVVSKVSSCDFVTAAARPRNTSFDNREMKRVFGIEPESLVSSLEKLVLQSRVRNKMAA